DAAAFASKNLRNAANYLVRQSFIHEHIYLDNVKIYHLIKSHEAYKALPAKVSNQVLIQLHKAWVAFFEAMEAGNCMAQPDARLIGGIYRIGQTITTGGMLTTHTAYNNNTNDVVGLYVITLQTQEQVGTAHSLLQGLIKRQSLYDSYVMRVH